MGDYCGATSNPKRFDRAQDVYHCGHVGYLPFEIGTSMGGRLFQ